MKNAYKIVVRKPEGQGPHGKASHRKNNNIKMALKEMVFEGVDWNKLVQDGVQWRNFVNTVSIKEIT